MKLSHKLLSMIIAISLLLTGSILPITASALTDDINSPNELVLNEEILKSEDPILTDKVVLRAEDPLISKESTILKYIDSSQFNAAQHVQRLTELEDLNTYVFANADGTRSIYMMHENVKYVDADGIIREKDISLKSKTGGFGIVQSDVELLIPNNPVQGVDLEYSGFSIKLIPQGLTNTVSAAQSDNSVVYDEAYGENTKLVYTPMLSGVKEDIVLSEYTANATYSFILETDGLFVYNGDGSYYLANSGKAEPIFYLGEILIYDAVGKPAVGAMTVEEVTAGEKYLLTVTADDDFLSDPATVYPVTIDPSITVSDSTTTGSILDAPIFERFPAKNFGTYVYNRAGTPSEAYGIGRTVVKLSGLTSSTEYQTITANQITNVSFYAKEASGGNTQYINLYPLTSNTTWTESTVTWNNVGSFNTSVNFGNTMYNNQWTAFNITDLVKGWKNGTYSADAGFIMTNENEANNKSFCASEYSTASYRPYVTMTYEPTFCGGDSFDNAEVITLNTYHTVNIDTQYELKYFKFVPPATGMYSLTSSSNTCDSKAWLYNSSEQQLDYDDDRAGNRNFCLTYHLMAGTTYYFEVGCYYTGTGIYDVQISVADSSSKINYTSMTLGTSRSVSITTPHKLACYRITPSETKEYLFFSSNKVGDPEMWLYNSSFEYVDDNDDGAGNLNFRLGITLNAGNTYYLIVRHHYAGVGSFNLNSYGDAGVVTATYFIQNEATSLYIDIDGPGTQEFVHQWSLHTSLQERWDIQKQTDGFYTIRSKYGSRKYIGISSSSTGVDNIKLYSSISDSVKWKIFISNNGKILFEPKTALSKVLSSVSSTIGDELQLTHLYSCDASYADRWNIIRMNPTNGYEITYDESKWSSYISNCCNCYAYALNNQAYPGYNLLWYKQQPGEYSGNRISGASDYTEEGIYNRVLADYSLYNEVFSDSLSFQRIGQYDICPAGTYKVALVVDLIGEQTDYHWYRQDSDGFWSHKQGTTPVKRTDESGDLIIDPYYADRGEYTIFLGYYAVTPWSNAYTQTTPVMCYVEGYAIEYYELMAILEQIYGGYQADRSDTVELSAAQIQTLKESVVRLYESVDDNKQTKMSVEQYEIKNE